MSEKPRLIAAGNTMVPAYLALLQKGYRVERTRAGENETSCAEGVTCCFSADDPLILLGLVALYETRGGGWPASDDEIDAFIGEYYG